MPFTNNQPCPICDGVSPEDSCNTSVRASWRLVCRICGDHRIASDVIEELPHLHLSRMDRARVAHGVVQLSRNVVLSMRLIEELLQNQRLPNPLEMINRLVLWLAEQGPPGFSRNILPDDIQAIVGAVDQYGAVWVRDEAENIGYIESFQGDHGSDDCHFLLTSKGWGRQSELLIGGAGSKHAFMAMKFDEPECEEFFRRYVAPSVKSRTGFDVRQSRDAHQTAGSIDNTMRVDIRTARFVICDLTTGNQGAYWEAGFAEGIGRPVFYICRDREADSGDPSVKPHFDVQQQPVIRWNLLDPKTAIDKLVAIIRATLPAESRMEDIPDN